MHRRHNPICFLANPKDWPSHARTETRTNPRGHEYFSTSSSGGNGITRNERRSPLAMIVSVGDLGVASGKLRARTMRNDYSTTRHTVENSLSKVASSSSLSLSFFLRPHLAIQREEAVLSIEGKVKLESVFAKRLWRNRTVPHPSTGLPLSLARLCAPVFNRSRDISRYAGFPEDSSKGEKPSHGVFIARRDFGTL